MADTTGSTDKRKRPKSITPRGQHTGMKVSGSARLIGEASATLLTSNREPTTLERCTTQQSENSDVLMAISRRINSLATRLQGDTLTGCGEESGDRESEGLLGDHLHALEVEAHLLGSLMSDLDQLEQLL